MLLDLQVRYRVIQNHIRCKQACDLCETAAGALEQRSYQLQLLRHRMGNVRPDVLQLLCIEGPPRLATDGIRLHTQARKWI